MGSKWWVRERDLDLVNGFPVIGHAGGKGLTALDFLGDEAGWEPAPLEDVVVEAQMIGWVSKDHCSNQY